MIWLLTVDCDPFYLELNQRQALDIEHALEPLGGIVQLNLIEPIDAKAKTLLEVISRHAGSVTDANVLEQVDSLRGELTMLAETER